jgi:hypothetical protein
MGLPTQRRWGGAGTEEGWNGRDQTSAFGNGSIGWLAENPLLEKYLTDSIHVKC